MIRCFDILTGCNSVLIWIRLLPDPVKIRPDPTVMDPAGSGVMDPAGSDSNGSGRIRSNGPGRIRIRPDPKIWDPVHPYKKAVLLQGN